MVERINEEKNNIRDKVRLDENESRVNRIIEPYDKVRRVVNDILNSSDGK